MGSNWRMNYYDLLFRLFHSIPFAHLEYPFSNALCECVCRIEMTWGEVEGVVKAYDKTSKYTRTQHAGFIFLELKVNVSSSVTEMCALVWKYGNEIIDCLSPNSKTQRGQGCFSFSLHIIKKDTGLFCVELDSLEEESERKRERENTYVCRWRWKWTFVTVAPLFMYGTTDFAFISLASVCVWRWLRRTPTWIYDSRRKEGRRLLLST